MNLNTFEGVEDLKNYNSNQALNAYRREALETFKPMAFFLKDLIKNQEISLLEVGSGNSSLLYNISNMGCLKKGIGIELARTRYIFAEKWKVDCNIKNVTNINDDFRNINLSPNFCDVLVCNSTFQYFNESLAKELIKKAYKYLSNDGILFLNIPTYRSKMIDIKNGNYIFLKEFEETNPFGWAVYEIKEFEENNYLNRSIYFDKSGKFKTKKEDKIFFWSEEDIKKILSLNSFNEIKIYGSLDKVLYNQDSHDEMFIIAKKQSKEVIL